MTSPRTINLLRGWPHYSLLPREMMLKASGLALGDKTISDQGLEYAPDQGYPKLREALGAWLGKFYGYDPTPADLPPASKRICVTGGASQNLAVVLAGFSDPVYTRHIWMIAPTYFLACRMVEDAGFPGRMKAVQEDEEGIDVEALEKMLVQAEREAKEKGITQPEYKPSRPWSKIYKHIIYAVPTFSNPTGKTMSLQRREALVRLARTFDALIVTDDVYDMLQWPADKELGEAKVSSLLPRLVDVDRELDGGFYRANAEHKFGNTLSNGSFSKIIGPGVRTGWAEGSAELAYALSQVGSNRSGGAASGLVATIIAEAVAKGEVETHIRETLIPAYHKRQQAIANAINEHLLPLGVSVAAAASTASSGPMAGGYFTWLYLPKPLKAAVVAEVALKKEQLIIAAGDLFKVAGDSGEQNQFGEAVRLCFAWEDEGYLVEGVERLAKVVNELLEGKGGEIASDLDLETFR